MVVSGGSDDRPQVLPPPPSQGTSLGDLLGGDASEGPGLPATESSEDIAAKLAKNVLGVAASGEQKLEYISEFRFQEPKTVSLIFLVDRSYSMHGVHSFVLCKHRNFENNIFMPAVPETLE